MRSLWCAAVAKTASAWKAQRYFVQGFSDASPDAGVGALLAYAF